MHKNQAFWALLNFIGFEQFFYIMLYTVETIRPVWVRAIDWSPCINLHQPHSTTAKAPCITPSYRVSVWRSCEKLSKALGASIDLPVLDVFELMVLLHDTCGREPSSS